jgi:drug/metabolite transporter (DMT)-like permease
MSNQTTTSPIMGAREWGMLIALSVVWGGSFFFAEVALADIPPLTLVLGRVGLAALCLGLFLAASGRLPRLDLRLCGAFLVMGALNNALPFTLIFWGQVHIASALASILNAATPVFTVLLAHLLTRDERMTPAKLMGVAAGFAGVVVMIGPDALSGLGAAVLAQLAVLGATVSYAFAGIYGRRFRSLRPEVTAAGQLGASTLLIAPIAFFVDRPWELPMPTTVSWGALIALAVLSTALAYILYFRILRTAGATNLLLVTFLVPVSAILLGVGILGERLAAGQIAGMLLITLGLLVIDGRLARRLMRPRDGNGQSRPCSPISSLRRATKASMASSRSDGKAGCS